MAIIKPLKPFDEKEHQKQIEENYQRDCNQRELEFKNYIRSIILDVLKEDKKEFMAP